MTYNLSKAEVRWGGEGGGTRLKQTPVTTLAPLDGDGNGVDWREWEREEEDDLLLFFVCIEREREARDLVFDLYEKKVM